MTNFEIFTENNKATAEWLQAASLRGFDFATSMIAAINRYGSLTPRQSEAIANCMARDSIRKQVATIDPAGIDRLKAAFDKAIAFSAEKGLKLSPKITIGGITISPAKATSRNPGALYVKVRGAEYLGKIADGKFYASRDCTKEQASKIQSFIADPAEAAKVYGQTTGTCCICNATLRSEWKHRGIGPICAQKFGW